MSFSEDVRNELAAIAPERECDRQAELSALFHAAGRWHKRAGGVSLHLDVSSSAVARRAFSLLRSFGVDSEIRTYRRRAFDRATRYQLHVDGTARAVGILKECGVLGARLQPLPHPRSGSSVAHAAGAPTCADPCWRRGRSRRDRRRTSR